MGSWRYWWRQVRRRPDDEWGRARYSYGPAPWSPRVPLDAGGQPDGRSPADGRGPAGVHPPVDGRPPVGGPFPLSTRRRRRFRSTLLTLILFVLLPSLLLSGLYQMDRRFRPSLAAIAEMKAKSIASQAINEALASEIFADVRYDQLMDVKTDPSGERVLLLQANGPELSRIAGRAQKRVFERLQALDGQPVRVPAAQVFGWTLFNEWGPSFRVTLQPIGAVVTDVRQTFQTGGINQTQHILYAHTEVTVRVLVPLVARDVKVETNTFITAAVLNGEVPNFYMTGGTVGGTSGGSLAPQSQPLPPLLVPGTPYQPPVGSGP